MAGESAAARGVRRWVFLATVGLGTMALSLFWYVWSDRSPTDLGEYVSDLLFGLGIIVYAGFRGIILALREMRE